MARLRRELVNLGLTVYCVCFYFWGAVGSPSGHRYRQPLSHFPASERSVHCRCDRYVPWFCSILLLFYDLFLRCRLQRGFAMLLFIVVSLRQRSLACRRPRRAIYGQLNRVNDVVAYQYFGFVTDGGAQAYYSAALQRHTRLVQGAFRAFVREHKGGVGATVLQDEVALLAEDARMQMRDIAKWGDQIAFDAAPQGERFTVAFEFEKGLAGVDQDLGYERACLVLHNLRTSCASVQRTPPVAVAVDVDAGGVGGMGLMAVSAGLSAVLVAPFCGDESALRVYDGETHMGAALARLGASTARVACECGAGGVMAALVGML